MKIKFYTARDGSKYKCIYNSKNELHNLEGPAVIFDCGYIEYWIEGVMLTKSQFKSYGILTLDYSSAVVDNGDSITF